MNVNVNAKPRFLEVQNIPKAEEIKINSSPKKLKTQGRYYLWPAKKKIKTGLAEKSLIGSLVHPQT